MPDRHQIDIDAQAMRGRLRSFDRPLQPSRPSINRSGQAVASSATPVGMDFAHKPVSPQVAQPQAQPVTHVRHTQSHVPISRSTTPAHAVSQPRQHRSNVLQRKAVQRSAAVIHKATRRRFQQPPSRIMIGLTVMSLVIALGSSIYAWRIRSGASGVAGESKVQRDDPDILKAGSTPIELPPTLDMYKDYSVPSALPRYLRIPALGVNARIRSVALDEQNQLQAPANIFDAGWYSRSAKPGSEGVMLMTSHISGPNMEGVFFGLTKLQPGNIIEVERGNTEKIRFKVVVVKIYENDTYNLATAMRPIEPGKPGLNLVTHGPILNPLTNKNDPRVVVYTVQM
jgi:hypothetical protein